MSHRIPPVSVIVSTCNRRGTLLRALTSIFLQAAACLEVLVVDDASSDGSREHIFGEVDRRRLTRLRWFTLPENLGPAAACNFGIVRAEGEMMAFLDSDDHWLPRKLAV